MPAPAELPGLEGGRQLVTPAAFVASLPSTGLRALVGAAGSSGLLAVRELARRGPVLVITPDLDAAQRATEDLGFLLRGDLGLGPEPVGLPPLLLPVSEASPWDPVQPDRRAALGRAATLFTLARGAAWRVLVAPATALLRKLVAPAVVARAGLRLTVSEPLDPRGAAAHLGRAGYLRVPLVEDPGSFAIRGGVLDVWPAGERHPVRAELDGELISALRTFEADGQRSLEAVEELWVPPAREAFLDEAALARASRRVRELCDAMDWPSSKTRALVADVEEGAAFPGFEGFLAAYHPLVPLEAWLPRDASVVVEDGAAVRRALDAAWGELVAWEAAARERPHLPRQELFLELAEAVTPLSTRCTVVLHTAGVAGAPDGPLAGLEQAPTDAPSLLASDHQDLTRAVQAARSQRGKQSALDPLVERLEAWEDEGLAVTLVARGRTQAERLTALLAHRGVRCAAGRLQVTVGSLERGFLLRSLGLVLLTEEEVFGRRAHRAPARRRSMRAVLEDLRALVPGDHVVHVDHGVGRYLGLERKKIGDAELELLVVEYQGGDRLFLPVYRLNQIQKWSGGEAAPRLDRLGGSTFAKTRAKAEKKVRQMADELLRLYAERATQHKEPLPPPEDDYATFEATFPFEETRDQQAAIEEVLADLSAPRVMDRLVCGDVGFGKTEVAIRAAFRVAMAGRQVAVLCPTTVLAQQHALSFQQRFADWPITVRALSRFQSAAEQAATLAGLKEGSVDVVIGTHRLLSKDVRFRRLGLLVVDEEQRFGVTHKERIKQLRRTVDALTLTATPIPRTLQLAIGGMREMSLIATPPADRRAIRTITSTWDERLVQEALERELSRGGQVYYVYNRVEGIYERAARLQALVPSARIAVGHGKLGEAELEATMLAFVRGEVDILCATAIVESGLDIPRANTILIDRADLFGLAQLYQLRGRVGRSNLRAYCYLLVPPPSQMTDEARARIEALERHTELGSGFQVAALDLELRGAGELLGAEQSGLSASVGFELFCRMLEEATRELQGEPVRHEVEPELSFDVAALLPDDYVPDVGVRLSLYKRLASAGDEAEVAQVAQEIEDRFGPPPMEVLALVEVMRIKTELRRLGALGIDASARSVVLRLGDETSLDPALVGALVARRGSPWRLAPDGRMSRRALEGERFGDGVAHADRALDELAGCRSAG